MMRRATPSPLLILCVCATLTTPTARAQSDRFLPLHWLTRDTLVSDFWPRFSPDGRTILFSRTLSPDAPSRLMLIRLDGGTPHLLLFQTPFASATRASWSRQVNRIAFTGGTTADDTTGIWIVDMDGRNLFRVPARGVSTRVMYPSWDPDGQSVVVVDYGAPGGARLKRISVRSGAAEVLTEPQQFLVGMPAVSPDGALIAFAGQRATGQAYDQTKNQIWVLPRGAAPYEISHGQGRQPDWSPNGEWLAFTSTRGDTAGRQAVFVVSRRGGPPRQLTSYATNADHPVWSPDGQFLVFSAQIPELHTAYGLALLPAMSP